MVITVKRVGVGVHQGSGLSPLPFILVQEVLWVWYWCAAGASLSLWPGAHRGLPGGVYIEAAAASLICWFPTQTTSDPGVLLRPGQVDVDSIMLDVEDTFCYLNDILCSGGGCDSAIAAYCLSSPSGTSHPRWVARSMATASLWLCSIIMKHGDWMSEYCSSLSLLAAEMVCVMEGSNLSRGRHDRSAVLTFRPCGLETARITLKYWVSDQFWMHIPALEGFFKYDIHRYHHDSCVF